ncbi:biotin transporter BioY [Crassaminicella profunda]|uniref:biotin transporter BioY n=1 Tax=Crassaminicella profunda TaxID=1286698 RepID=UPI001CA6E239|nr:biotin transporter BioY [Crassaminicella profunda]QZY56932.1 biotin transporter BioY [Crassaminicella profunda]
MKIRDMILISLFAALTAVGAFIKIPTPLVPFTLQFLFCAYSGVFLGAKYGLYSQLLYVGIGLAGIPIFTKGGGIHYIYQPTFGYLIGFIFCAFIIGLVTQNLKKITFIKVYIPVVVGLMVVYAIGVPYLYYMFNLTVEDPITFKTAIAWGFTPYIVPDLILSALVAFTSVKVIPILRKHGYIKY